MINVLAGLVSPEASLLALLTAAFSLCPYMAFSLICMHPWCFFLFLKGPNSIGLTVPLSL